MNQQLIPFTLILCHFAFDWVYQTHKEAMIKSHNSYIRTLHCIKYAGPFAPVLWAFGLNVDAIGACLAILFLTHYIIDSYVPVMLWAKYLRRAPEFDNVRKCRELRSWQDKVIEQRCYENDSEAFKAFASTPLGLILIITMDQFLHITCLLPVAMITMK